MKNRLSALLSAVVLAALAEGSALAAGADTGDVAIQARVEEAGAVSQVFLKQLGMAMKQEMQAGGPVAAVQVCRDKAPAIASELSLQKGWRVTRVGTRVRNPLLGMPDAWEQGVLKTFEKRAAQGEKYDSMTHFEVVEEPDGKSLRYMKPIAVAPQCLMCHGSQDEIVAPVRQQLKSMYPHDRAVAYRPGDLRGAVSIKQPLMD